jgi:integrase
MATRHLQEFIIACHAGMRLSEQFSLQWNQVDLDRKQIILRRKGQKFSAAVFPREDRSSVYTNRKEQRFDMRSWFERAVEAADIPAITWHGLRHTCGSWLAMAGASMKEIQTALGHKTITQASRYSHLSPQHTLSVIDRIADTHRASQHAPLHAPVARNPKAD